MSDIKLPGIGPVKKPVFLAGVGITAGILAFAYYRRSKAPAAVDASLPTADSSPSAIDPSTGLPYGSVDAGVGVGYGYPDYGGYGGSGSNPYGYDAYGNPIPAPTGVGSNGVYTTNNDWAAAGESVLENASVTLAVSTAAITRVLGGLSVTAQQRDYFMQVIGTLGPPPQGYPTPIHLVDTPTDPAPPTGVLPAPTGLKVVSTSTTHVTLQWNKVTGATSYRLYRSDVSVAVGASSDTKGDIGGLSHNHTYHFHVRAVGANNVLGASSASVSGKTKK